MVTTKAYGRAELGLSGASIGCPCLMAGMCRSVIIRKLLAFSGCSKYR
jgi:hypothetical protein